MRLIRAAGQNVSPSDDGRLYDQIFSDGLFTDTAFAMLGTNNVQIGAMYGDLCGRDFTIEQQTIAVALPEGDGEVTGYIFVEIDTTAETPLSVGSALAPFAPTYDDINVNGAVAQMIVAEYTADAVSVTSIKPVYDKAAAGAVQPGSVATVEKSPATAPHSVGEYILVSGVLYRVTSAISTGETISPGINVIAEPIGDALSELKSGLKFVKLHSGVQNITAASQAVPLADSPTNYDYLLVTVVANNTQKNVITHLKDDYGSNLRAYYFATPDFYGSFQCVVSGNSIVSSEAPALSGYSTLGIGTVYGVKYSVQHN